MATKTQTPKPNPSNQYLLDPRQDLCWDNYINPKSETFSNAYQSAVKAGYSLNHAKQITTEIWWSEKVRRINLLSKAEKVLEETIEMTTVLPVIGQFGPIMIPTGKFNKKGKEVKELLMGENDKLLKIKQDSAKFVAERLGKKKGYSTRQELTGADGKDLIPKPIYGGSSKGK